MAIGERIHHFRLKRGLTQKQLGVAVGFPERSADVRLAQYETETRTPKAELTQMLAAALDVDPRTLTVPDIDTDIGLAHTLFALEDTCGLSVCEENGTVFLRADVRHNSRADALYSMMLAWNEQHQKLLAGEISREEYDSWREHYPKEDAFRR